jgi:hypothetical protein
MDAFESNLCEIIQKKRLELDSKLFERERVKKELREAAVAATTTTGTENTTSSTTNPCANPTPNKAL